MTRIAFQFRAATREASRGLAMSGAGSSVGTGARARPSRAKRGYHPRALHLRASNRRNDAILFAPITLPVVALILAVCATASAATRPYYGGTLRIMMQSAPNTLDIPPNATPTEYWDASRTLSLICDTLVELDAAGRPIPALALAWQSDPSFRHWQFTLRPGVKFHDGTPASPAAIAQILGAIHPEWKLQAGTESLPASSLSIDIATSMPNLLAELALPRNLLLKRNSAGLPIGTGSFRVADWQPRTQLKLAANEESWAGRPFVDSVEIDYGESPRDQAIAVESNKADVIEAAPRPSNASPALNPSSALTSLPVELMALAFSANSKTQDVRLREALALAIDRRSIQTVLLKGVGTVSATILPNWMTGYSALFSTQSNLQRARAVLANSRQPALILSYDPIDPQAQLIAERIALNAREIGITIQVSLTGNADIRLVRVVLPSPDPATYLIEVARQLGLRQPSFAATPRRDSLEDLYQSERDLLDEHQVIPLFHLPVTTSISARVRGWSPDQLGRWNGRDEWNGRNGATHSLADAWLADSQTEDRDASRSQADQR
jgi:peptide/nickel transport system substrate-binding protein